MKTRSKLLSIALSLVLAVGLCPTPAFAQSLIMVQSMQLTTQAANPYENVYQDADGDGYYEAPCTKVAWQKAYDVCGVALPSWGNANTWLASAKAAGYSTGSTAQVNSIAVFNSGYYGHVSFVTAVNGTRMTVYEGGRTDLDTTASHGVGTSTPSSVVGQGGLIGFIYLTGSAHNPEGWLDVATGGDGTVYVKGWALDRDDQNANLEVHIYVGGSGIDGEKHVLSANRSRSDVNSALGVSGSHGFEATLQTSQRGSVPVYAHVVNVGGGNNVQLSDSPKRVKVTYPPQGWLDAAVGGDGTVHVRGWALDNDYPNAQLQVHVYVGGTSATGEKHKGITANLPYASVNKVTGVPGNHGFDATFTTNKHGSVKVYAYAINPDKDKGNPQLSGVCTTTVLDPKNGASSVAEATYAIRTKMSASKGLDVNGLSQANKANVMLCSWNGGDNQKFAVKPAGDGSYYVVAKHSGKAVEVTDGLVENGANVAQYTLNNSVAQRWFFDRNPDGTYRIRQRQSGLVMDVYGKRTDNGTNIMQGSPNGGDNQKFYLVPTDASMWSVSVADQAHTGKAVTPAPTVTAGGVEMRAGTDYTVSYKNNVKLGTASVTVKAKNGYTGSKTISFRIGKTLTGVTVSGVKAKTYTGKALTQSPEVKVGGKALKAGADYTLSYANNVKTGKATMTITGKGSYTGTKAVPFTIAKANVKNATAAKVKAQKYKKGKAIKPNPKITYKDKTLKKGADYTLKYKNNKKRGTATITVKGKGNFKGSKAIKFKIR